MLSKEGMIYHAMKRRCYDPRNKDYHRYGGRGIKVCDRWKDSWKAFLSDMGRRPQGLDSLERIDTNGDYTPDNCRWATFQDQANNRRSNRRHTRDGVTMTIAQWCRRVGVKHTLVVGRMHNGWDIDRALDEPVHSNKRNTRYHEVHS